jgi:DNA-binding response OmpR family regulator
MESMPFDCRTSHVVLIVDDMPENLAVLRDALDESGYYVIVAQNGVAALELASAVIPDIILLDSSMPGMDGLEVCRRLRRQIATRHVPVIVMAAPGDADLVVAAFDAGATDLVAKPARQSEVLARIGAHLRTARLMDQARGALDAFGNAMLAIAPQDGRIVWQTPLARQWMQTYFASAGADTPPALAAWLAAAPGARAAGVQHTKVTGEGSERVDGFE